MHRFVSRAAARAGKALRRRRQATKRGCFAANSATVAFGVHRARTFAHCRQRRGPRPPRYGSRQTARQACGEIFSAARQAARKSSFSDADRRCADHVAGTGHRKRRDRQAARQRLQQHQAEGVGPARKHEDVGGGIDLRQFLALPRAEKYRLRIFPLQRRARRPVADDQLGAGQIEIEKRFEVLLHRDAADTEKDRPRQAEVDGARMKQAVSTPRGHSTTLRKPRPRNSLASAGVAAITAWLGAVEPAQRRPDPAIPESAERAEMYSGKRVWKLVVNGKPCLRQ